MDNNFSREEFANHIREIALKSILYEVAATPKPGLVDRNNSGAHRDMDFFSFLASSAALSNVFAECALEGISFTSSDFRKLLDRIRPIGIAAEKNMYRATEGINTHKGLIFSLGIVSAAAGNIYSETKNKKIDAEDVCERVKKITEGVTKREFKDLEKKEKLTYGEMLYRTYGIKGIRGEAESGFETVRRVSLPILRKLIKEERNILNDILVQVLLHLMTEVEDSNVLGRHGFKTLDYVRDCARKALDIGGMYTEKGREYVKKMDRDFIEKNISPGGSADLLAVTLMFIFLENPLSQ